MTMECADETKEQTITSLQLKQFCNCHSLCNSTYDLLFLTLLVRHISDVFSRLY